MKRQDLEVLNDVPFLFWAKDAEGTYVWGNRAINELAGENVVGKPDAELEWADNAQALREDDRRVLESGEPMFVREYVDHSERGKASLSVCKWADELDGTPHAFGISFVIDE